MGDATTIGSRFTRAGSAAAAASDAAPPLPKQARSPARVAAAPSVRVVTLQQQQQQQYRDAPVYDSTVALSLAGAGDSTSTSPADAKTLLTIAVVGVALLLVLCAFLAVRVVSLGAAHKSSVDAQRGLQEQLAAAAAAASRTHVGRVPPPPQQQQEEEPGGGAVTDLTSAAAATAWLSQAGSVVLAYRPSCPMCVQSMQAYITASTDPSAAHIKFARINVQAVPGGWPDQARNTPGLPTWLVRTPAGVLTRIIGRRAAPEQFLASLHSKLADFSSDVGGDPACVHKKEDGTFEKVPCVPLE